MQKRYTVRVNIPSPKPAGWTYEANYFPRAWRYESHAVSCAETAIANGATMARVEYPDGGERDFYPKKQAGDKQK